MPECHDNLKAGDRCRLNAVSRFPAFPLLSAGEGGLHVGCQSLEGFLHSLVGVMQFRLAVFQQLQGSRGVFGQTVDVAIRTLHCLLYTSDAADD